MPFALNTTVLTYRRFAWLLLVGIVLAYAIYAFLWPLLTVPGQSEQQRFALTATEVMRERAFPPIVAAWFFVLGSVIGSFMNVVVWRVPRGESIVGPSHCPKCESNIRPRDNVPVFGWLLLNGRCRDCGVSISPRYPLVELLYGLVFLALAGVEIFGGGMNLPLRAAAFGRGLDNVIMGRSWDLVAAFAVHVFLMSILISWALIQFDRQAIPKSYALFAFAAGLVLIVSLDGIFPLAWFGLSPPNWATPGGTRCLNGLIGAGVGWLQAVAIAGCLRSAGKNRPSMLAPLPFVGLILGWQGLISATLLSALLALGVAGLSRAFARCGRVPILGCLAAGTLLQLLFWQQLASFAWLPGADTTWAGGLAFGAIGAIALGLALVLQRAPAVAETSAAEATPKADSELASDDGRS